MENKRNYQRELDDILKRIEKNEKKPVLCRTAAADHAKVMCLNILRSIFI